MFRNSNFRIAIMLAVVLYSISVNAQKLMGVVVEKNANGVDEPLAGANIVWMGSTTGTTSGSNGVFMIDRVEGTSKLVVSYVGYKSDTLTITNQTRIKVTLVSDEYLQEVTVVGWRPSSGIDHARGINTVIMTEKELFKAACCNLSESFETNPSVDVAFTDAITGTRQIQMLGLSGPNTMISIENMPGVRGLASSQGIQFIPGTWINSIQVTKGVGSVINGYESIAGQINVEMKKPEESERLYINGYVNNAARSELNVNYTAHTSDKWATTFLLHGSTRPFEMDSNDDSFLDFPTGSQLNFINRWVYNNNKGLLGQFGIKVLTDTKQGGQTDFNPEQDKLTTNRYGFEINTQRYEAWGKLGYQFTGKPYKSIGLQLSATRHDHDSYYGFNIHAADEKSLYVNLIYQSIIGSTYHKFKTGISFLYDDFKESLANPVLAINYNGSLLNDITFNRTEMVPGIFAEYSYDGNGKFSAIVGARADYHSLFGTLFNPRIHLKYDATETTTLRLSAGKGVRVANILTENTGILASSRQLVFSGLQSGKAYGFKPDQAWNFGITLSQDFTLDYRPGAITMDYFFTDFENQVVLDLDNTAREARFFGLNGKSFSHSFQFQVDYELMRRFDLRMAYRWLNVQTDYTEGRLARPLIPEHRAFVNLAYETKNKWKFDYTVQWMGKQRIPDTSQNISDYQLPAYSPDYFLMNAQITKDIKDKWSVYLGVENLNNYTLDNPIIAADQPFSQYFDTSLVWGPIFGTMAYAGFRFRIK
ncbi:MAG: TonB-dependent receptor [Cyclobacteriaceae bacterium]|nr:TonB-dependent receptor [Cyclobacteriaceae bacterium]UYN88252.1 MAG: TonB-dependent receptor [Cyclobacteriaceae bacterium]